MRMLRRGRRQQAKLHLARHGEVALQSLLLAGDTLIEPRILNGDCDLRGQGARVRSCSSLKIVGARVLEVEHADDRVLVE